jgi:hypothetical protein
MDPKPIVLAVEVVLIIVASVEALCCNSERRGESAILAGRGGNHGRAATTQAI